MHNGIGQLEKKVMRIVSLLPKPRLDAYIGVIFQVKRLEGQIGCLSDHQNKTEEKHVRMKEENGLLIER